MLQNVHDTGSWCHLQYVIANLDCHSFTCLCFVFLFKSAFPGLQMWPPENYPAISHNSHIHIHLITDYTHLESITTLLAHTKLSFIAKYLHNVGIHLMYQAFDLYSCSLFVSLLFMGFNLSNPTYEAPDLLHVYDIDCAFWTCLLFAILNKSIICNCSCVWHKLP